MESEKEFFTKSNLVVMIPRLVKTFKASEGAWYANWIGEEYVVLDSYEDFYVVCTFNGYGEMIPSLIKICDCSIIER